MGVLIWDTPTLLLSWKKIKKLSKVYKNRKNIEKYLEVIFILHIFAVIIRIRVIFELKVLGFY